MLTVTVVGSVIVAQTFAVQPKLSVTVTQYTPAIKPVAVAVVWLFALAAH